MHLRPLLAMVLLAMVLAALTLAAAREAAAQFVDEQQADVNPRLENPNKVKWRVGLVVRAGNRPLKGVYATMPVPLEWEEQKVRIVDEQRTPGVQELKYRTINSTMRQMVVNIPFVPAGGEARANADFEIIRYGIKAPTETASLKIPEKVDSSLRQYLLPSPLIEVRHAKIRELAKQVKAEYADKSDWEKVETIYDRVREKVKYQNGKIKGALAALNDGTGDCEELTSLFIAVCRANGIPARTVWVPEHCYPEFYLVDSSGKGQWYPCQAAGDKAFGNMPERRPILQKGDNFQGENGKAQRYMAEFLKVKDTGGSKPKVEFIRTMLPD